MERETAPHNRPPSLVWRASEANSTAQFPLDEPIPFGPDRQNCELLGKQIWKEPEALSRILARSDSAMAPRT
jgi:hypothetical protein